MLNHTRLMCLLTLSAIAVSAQIVSVPTANQTTGMIGIADAQTAQLNLLNISVVPPTATGVFCSAVVAFVDANGAVLKSTTLDVAPGKSLPFDLRSDTDLQLVTGDRREVRATISIPSVIPVTAGAGASAAPPCTLLPTLEIFDTVTGRTLVALGHAATVPAAPATNP
jgi:hypothetical protein